MPSRRSLTWVLVTALFLPALARAQSFNGAITGVVRDIATNQVVATAVTGGTGEYSFRNLAPATYEVLATKPGFQQLVLPDLVVTLSSQLRVDVTLPVGTL